MSEISLPIAPGRYRTAMGDVAVITRVDANGARPVVGHVVDGMDWCADGRYIDADEGGCLRLVERLPDPDPLPDSRLPDPVPEPDARLRRENERLRAANRLHEIARDCCAAEVERLREMVADLESQLAFANDCADMRDREAEVLREQLSEQGIAPQIGLTIAGEIVRVPDSLPDSSICTHGGHFGDCPDCRH